jgi:hypothetical protein
MPVNCQRAAGLKELRYVRRIWLAGVAQDPPRRIIWLDMNFPLYSLRGPGNGL